MKKFILVIAILLFCSNTLNTVTFALPIGYTKAGSNTIISDTGLQWLSPVASDGWSYNDILQDVNVYGTASTFYGFERATDTQFYQLIQDYGLSDTGWAFSVHNSDLENDSNRDFLFSDFGVTYSNIGTGAELRIAYGQLLAEIDGVLLFGIVGRLDDSETGFIKLLQSTSSTSRLPPPLGSVGTDWWGQWLVKSTVVSGPIPEPTTIALLGIGIVAFIALRTRRMRK